ncbi:hypothetical protein QR680_001081 [Steinernema hermaphroditum]|uniref:Uncharacterized protein n=1 Tax=Steinernema hermaphroditum TaxID=289476 RepID=A0AA39GWW3_9BILA|nr:hypothetical protein QR680_001081 [Steinernema hermaphroditum]
MSEFRIIRSSSNDVVRTGFGSCPPRLIARSVSGPIYGQMPQATHRVRKELRLLNDWYGLYLDEKYRPVKPRPERFAGLYYDLLEAPYNWSNSYRYWNTEFPLNAYHTRGFRNFNYDLSYNLNYLLDRTYARANTRHYTYSYYHPRH